MRPLRDLIPRALPPKEPGPVEPVALLAAIVRETHEFDAEVVFDRALFGIGADDVRGLGGVMPHVCEVAYEALERSGIRIERLRTLRVGTWLGVSDPTWVTIRDAAFLADLLGIPGPACTVIEAGAGLSFAVHAACEAVRSGDVDLALVAGDHGEGVGSVVVGRMEEVADRGRVRALILGSAANRSAEDSPPRLVAAARAGIDEKALVSIASPGAAGLAEAIAALQAGETRTLVVSELGEASAAHVVVGVAEEGAAAEHSPRILGLTARSSRALRDLVRGALERMQTEADLFGVANDALSRPGFEHRVATPVRALADVRTRLDAYLRGDPSPVASGYAVEASVAFVIPPAGAQYVRMTDRLYGSEPAFREALNRCDRALRTVLPRPLLSVLYPALGREVPLDDPIFANPITFSVAFALAELLRSRGVVPGAVLGCGVGELAAAAIAGAVDPEEAVRVAAERGRLLGTLTAEAGRVVIGTSEGVARTLLEGLPTADIVALPMPERVVIGGAQEAVAEVVERARVAGLQTERMVGFPNNTPLVDPILGAFSSAATALRFETPEIGWVSAATGRRTEHADAAHWAATIRGPVRFSQAVETLYSLGCRSFVELSRPTLLPAGERTLSDQPSWWFSALDPKADDREHLEEILSSLWVLGAPVERGPGGRFPGAAELPTYPWDRRPLAEEEEERLVAELYRSHADYEGVWVPELTSGDDADEPDVQPPEEQELELELDPDPDVSDAPGDPEPAPEPEVAVVPQSAGNDSFVPLSDAIARHADDAPNAEPAAELSEGDLSVEAAVPTERRPVPPSVPQAAQEDEARDLLDLDADGAPVSLPPFQLRPSLSRESDRVPTPDGADIDDLSSSPPVVSRVEEYKEELTLDELRTPQRQQQPVEAMVVVEDEPTGEADLTAGLLDEELEDIEVDAYSGPPPMTLEEAELAADAGVLWEEVWSPDPLPEVASDETTTWVVLVDAGGVGDYLSTLLEASGNRIVRVLHETPYPRDDRTLFVPDPTEPSAFEVVVEALGTVHGAVRILHLWALDATDEPADSSGGWAGIVGLVQELRAQSVPARLHLVTRGAFRPTDTASGQTLGAIWGLARVLAVEVPFLFGGIVDLDPEDEDPDALLRHLLGGGTDAQPVVLGALRSRQEYQLRAGAERYRRTVQPVSRVPVATAELVTDGPWVIAGDVDGSALELVHWLVSRGVTKVFLIGSQPPPPDVLRGVLELQRKNVGCIVVRADPADPKDAGQVRSRLAREGAVRGVVLRIAASPCSLQELDLTAATAALTRATAMQALLWDLAPTAARWIWSEGRSFDGTPGGGVAAIAGEALTAAIRVPGAAGTAVHTGPSTELSSGQAVRLMSRLGPSGGVHGVWRGKGSDTPPPALRSSDRSSDSSLRPDPVVRKT